MATETITISNTGTGPLTANVTAPKHDPPPFTEVSGGSGIVIGLGAHHDVMIVYSPRKKVSTSDQVEITSTGAGQKKPIKVKIKGKAN